MNEFLGSIPFVVTDSASLERALKFEDAQGKTLEVKGAGEAHLAFIEGTVCPIIIRRKGASLVLSAEIPELFDETEEAIAPLRGEHDLRNWVAKAEHLGPEA